MEKFISDLNKHYRLDNSRIKDDVVIFEINSTLELVECPYCGQALSKIHSHYQREIQDLPMQNKKVILLVKTRKMFCMNNVCSRRTFAEKHSFTNANGKITNRLERNIIYASTQLSSVGA